MVAGTVTLKDGWRKVLLPQLDLRVNKIGAGEAISKPKRRGNADLIDTLAKKGKRHNTFDRVNKE